MLLQAQAQGSVSDSLHLQVQTDSNLSAGSHHSSGNGEDAQLTEVVSSLDNELNERLMLLNVFSRHYMLLFTLNLGTNFNTVRFYLTYG